MTLIQPYKHDCPNCKWVGWFTPQHSNVHYNMYYCEYEKYTASIVLRYGNEGHEYESFPVGLTVKGPLELSRE